MSEVDLTTCDREPIHIPGAIQPHGVLFACRATDLVVAQVSTNVVDHLGTPADAILGRPLSSLFRAADAEVLTRAAQEPVLRVVNPLRLTTLAGAGFEAVLHRPPAGELVVVELEPLGASVPSARSPGPIFDPGLRQAIVRLSSSGDLESLVRSAATEVRRITGFDRVMIYRFDAQWNGQVVAEAKRDDLDSFLGQHYPASDIPAQARRLYELNWLRLIADVGYAPSPILDPQRGAPLDLSFAVLRSVSPIHIQYLKNMGVTASMSVSLLREGKLAGLIACHHYSGPHVVSYSMRETAEYLAQALSWHVAVLETAENAERTKRARELEAQIVQRLAIAPDLLEGLAGAPLLELASATGAAVVLAEGTRRLGTAPDATQLTKLVDFLKHREGDVYRTDHLSADLPEAERWDDVAAGVLAVTISRELGEYLLWFRASSDRVIDWGGNPHQAKLTGGEGEPERLSPRGSFALWREVIKGRSLPWQPWEVDAASAVRAVLLAGVRKRAAELRVLNQRLVDADTAKDNFIATVSHELRTPLNAMSGWVQLLRSGQVAPERMQHALDVVHRNAVAQGQLIEDLLDVSRMTTGKLTLEIETVDLPSLVQKTLESTVLAVDAKGLRLTSSIDTDAPPVLGDPGRLRQIVANLLNNAVKFAKKGGSIHVALQRVGSDLQLAVVDDGQGIAPAFLPHIFEVFRQQDPGMNRRSQGLGLGLAIARKLVELHGGRISVQSEGEGLGATFRVTFPTATRAPAAPASRASDDPFELRPELVGLRVLVVEDDLDSRELIEHILTQCGAAVAVAVDVAEALALLDATPTFDVIVSDIGLPGVDGLEFIRRVRARSKEAGGATPAIALTAYTRAADRTQTLRAGFESHVPKPVEAGELVATILAVVRRR